jgi:hypothetical protein
MRITRSDGWLLLILLLLAAAIAGKAYWDVDGYLSPDSTAYLGLARSLLDGRGLLLPGEGSPVGSSYCAIWPLGYPWLIALVARLGTISPFVASKLLNALLLGGILLLLRNRFGSRAPIYALPLFFASYLELFAFTWSESLFVFFFLAFALVLQRTLEGPALRPGSLLVLLGSAVGMFLARYLGAMACGLLFAAALYAWRRGERRKSAALLLVMSAHCVAIGGYLYHNWVSTGYLTGIVRPPAVESPGEFAAMLLSAVRLELVLPVAVVSADTTGFLNAALLLQVAIIGCGVVWIRRTPRQEMEPRCSTLPLVLAGAGSLYLLLVIGLRAITLFDPIGFRLLAPGTLLLWIAGIRLSEERCSPVRFRRLAILLLLPAGGSLVVDGVVKTWFQFTGHTYPDRAAALRDRYAAVPSGSVVIFGDLDLRYLRPDLLLFRPHYTPYWLHAEPWEPFLARVAAATASRPLYLRCPDALDPERFEASVVAAVGDCAPGSLRLLAMLPAAGVSGGAEGAEQGL